MPSENLPCRFLPSSHIEQPGISTVFRCYCISDESKESKSLRTFRQHGRLAAIFSIEPRKVKVTVANRIPGSPTGLDAPFPERRTFLVMFSLYGFFLLSCWILPQHSRDERHLALRSVLCSCKVQKKSRSPELRLKTPGEPLRNHLSSSGGCLALRHRTLGQCTCIVHDIYVQNGTTTRLVAQ